MGSSLATAS